VQSALFMSGNQIAVIQDSSSNVSSVIEAEHSLSKDSFYNNIQMNSADELESNTLYNANKPGFIKNGTLNDGSLDENEVAEFDEENEEIDGNEQLQVQKIENARRASMSMLSNLIHKTSSLANAACVNGRHSVQHMKVLSGLDKTGYLMKQSKLLGR
jgi:hypothetical protein